VFKIENIYNDITRVDPQEDGPIHEEEQTDG